MSEVAPEAPLRSSSVPANEDVVDQAGRLPFPVRLGVTGHRKLPAGLEPAVDGQLERLAGLLLPGPGSSQADLRLTIVSQLAEGADRLVVSRVLEWGRESGRQARLEVVLPFEKEQYAALQHFSEASRLEFDHLLDRASFFAEPDDCGAGTYSEEADEYATAGKKVIRRCDVLIAIWDGRPARGRRGGTADTLLMAAAQGKPCIWIPTDGAAPLDNLQPGTGRTFFDEVRTRSQIDGAFSPPVRAYMWCLQPLFDASQALENYNAEPRPWQRSGAASGRVARRVAYAVARFVDHPSNSRFTQTLTRRVREQLAAGLPVGFAAPLVRASVLADHYRKRFMTHAAIVFASATVAACALAVGVSAERSPLWPALELACLITAAIGFLVARELDIHSRWLSYRVLAERLRIARYVSPVGFDFREYAELQGTSVGNPAEEWLMRAVEETWARMPRTSDIRDDELDALKRLLSDEWLQGQIDYHAQAEAKHKRVAWSLPALLMAAIAATLLCAALEFGGVAAHASWLERVARASLIALPVGAAALGGWLTVSQHDALEARSAQMHDYLTDVQRDVRDANNVCALRVASAEAIRILGPETGTWMGHLWFLDIEHP